MATAANRLALSTAPRRADLGACELVQHRLRALLRAQAALALLALINREPAHDLQPRPRSPSAVLRVKLADRSLSLGTRRRYAPDFRFAYFVRGE